MVEAIVSVIVERLCELVIEETEALHGSNGHVEKIQSDLRSLQCSLKDAESRRIHEQHIRTWMADVQELAYDASDVVEEYVADLIFLATTSKSKKSSGGIKSILKRCFRVPSGLVSFGMERKINSIRKRITELVTRQSLYGISGSSSNRGIALMPRHYDRTVIVEQEVVGLEEDVKRLVAHLLEDVYKVVGIYGMGGLGKTTLARKLYNHDNIKGGFECLAWVCISQQWKSVDILKAILINLCPDRDNEEVTKLSEEELVKEILEVQSKKRCLIVLDDIWSNDAWDSLKVAFPLEDLSTRILLTTRNKQVAEHVDSKGFLHEPKLLDEEQSWELLNKKTRILDDGSASIDVNQMEEMGREMVKHCNGLPLGILVLGGILVTKRSLTEWERVHQYITSSLKCGKGMGEEHQNEVLKVLEFSYNNLPNQLKLCFLHLGQFPEDHELEAEQLYHIWIAEGFVISKDRNEGEKMLDVAECYLGELAQRSMVQLEFEDEGSCVRKFRSCRLHDLMRDLSIRKAEDEDFFKSLNFGQDSEESSSASTYTRRVVISGCDDPSDSKTINVIDKKVRRQLRSFIWFDNEKFPPVIRFRLQTFESLRVLSIENSTRFYEDEEFAEAIGKLTNLRFVSFRNSYFPKLPHVNSQYLQAFDVRLDQGVPCVWPGKFKLHNMGELKHLYLPSSVTMEGVQKLSLASSNNLETLINFATTFCEAKDLSKLPNLRKLTMSVEQRLEDLEEIINYLSSTNSSSLQHSTLQILDCGLADGKGPSLLRELFLKGASNLHQLNISGNVGKLPVFDQNAHFLSSLTNLSIVYSNFGKDPMPTLEKIPNLRCLNIGGGDTEKEIVCSATGFSQLRELRIQRFPSLETWTMDEGAMPNLSFLDISVCWKLAMLPDAVRFLKVLKTLNVRSMSIGFFHRLGLLDSPHGVDAYKIGHIPNVSVHLFA